MKCRIEASTAKTAWLSIGFGNGLKNASWNSGATSRVPAVGRLAQPANDATRKIAATRSNRMKAFTFASAAGLYPRAGHSMACCCAHYTPRAGTRICVVSICARAIRRRQEMLEIAEMRTRRDDQDEAVWRAADARVARALAFERTGARVRTDTDSAFQRRDTLAGIPCPQPDGKGAGAGRRRSGADGVFGDPALPGGKVSGGRADPRRRRGTGADVPLDILPGHGNRAAALARCAEHGDLSGREAA